jgi:CRISPR-associated protein Csx10
MSHTHSPQEVTLVCELLDDCVFAETSATDGGIRTLRHIPGAAIYGAAAARLYPALKLANRHADLWQLFHGGGVRFGNAYPLVQQRPAWPAPCTWQADKGANIKDHQGQLAVALANASAAEPARGAQRKPLRGQFITATGHLATPATSEQLKTAFNPGQGTAAHSQLFQYESLRSGQSFAAVLSCAPGTLSAQAWADLLATLDNTVLRLGRSRGAQYGRVRVQVLRQPCPGWALANQWVQSAHQQPSLILWCVSDLCLLDEHLQPTTTPSAAALGLPQGWTPAPANSYLQTRRYSPYNTYRQGHDSERLVIAAGSVLGFAWTGPQPPDHTPEQLRQRLGTWLGQHGPSGLGQVVVQPAWALSATLTPQVMASQATGQPVAAHRAAPATQPLTPQEEQWRQWIGQRAGQVGIHDAAAEWARQRSHTVRAICKAAATLVPGGLDAVMPSASQWGRVLEACHKYPANVAQLRGEIMATGGVLGGAGPEAASQNPKLRLKNTPWFHLAPFPHTRWSDGQARSATTLGDWLLDQLTDPAIAHCPGDALGRLASLCRRGLTPSNASTYTAP